MHSAMEQTRHWMWTRRRFTTVRPLNTVAASAGPSYESWEEQAFAEDSAGRLGGCIWPPRSYSCSFCRREFRSAQALGGHMNVHRRDRARLKQYSPSATSDVPDEHHSPLAAQFAPSPLCSLVYNPNPNFHKSLGVAATPPLSPPRVSASNNTYASSNTIIQEGIQDHGRKESVLSFPTPFVDLVAVQEQTVTQLKLGRDDDWRQREMGGRRRRDTSEDEEEIPNSKKRKADSMLPFFVTPASDNRGLLQSEVLKLGPSMVEELDLELRLGDRLA